MPFKASISMYILISMYVQNYVVTPNSYLVIKHITASYVDY